jgi:hypothetical protein
MSSANGRSISSAALCAVVRLMGLNPSASSQSATAVASAGFGRETMTLGRSATLRRNAATVPVIFRGFLVNEGGASDESAIEMKEP